MSKIELRVIARIVLIGVGLYVLLQTFLTILSNIAVMPLLASDQMKKDTPIIIIALGIYTTTALATIYFLARCANRISAKIVGPEPAEDIQVSWLAVAFRLVCVAVGVLFLYRLVPGMVVTLYQYTTINPNLHYMSPISDILKYVIMLGLSIYLAYGAPGFVRWQFKKTLKQCSKFEEHKSPWY
jgi:hypothetical protein